MRAIIFISVVLLTLTPASAGTHKAWKTLKNSNGFSIHYPPNWGVAAVGESPPTEELQIVVGGPSGARDRWVRIQLGAGSSAGGHTPYEMVHRDLIASNVKHPLAEMSVVIDGEPAYEVTYINPARRGSGMVWKYIAVRHHDRPYFLQIEEDGPDARRDISDKTWKYKDVIDRIVKSFRFTD